LRPIFKPLEDASLGIHVIYPPGLHLALKVRMLVDFLVKQFKG
jgi:hypothetical protein